jgi:hypothetical protein
LGQPLQAGLAQLAGGLSKPRGQKRLAEIFERIGRLKQKSRGATQHYEVTVTADEIRLRVAAVSGKKTPDRGSMFTHPGVYCVRSNEIGWDAAGLWQSYTMLTDLEPVFRGLKSELGVRPVFYHNDHRTEGHLFITVLPIYQLVQAIRLRLRVSAHPRTSLSLRLRNSAIRAARHRFWKTRFSKVVGICTLSPDLRGRKKPAGTKARAAPRRWRR